MTAIKVFIETRRARRAVSALNNAPRRMTKEILVALRESARDVAKETRVLLRRRKGGRSSPGEPPARQSGALAKNIRSRRARGLAYRVLVERDGYYGKFLETGTTNRRGRGRIEPRPFLTAARDDLSDQTSSRIQAAIERVLREAATR